MGLLVLNSQRRMDFMRRPMLLGSIALNALLCGLMVLNARNGVGSNRLEAPLVRSRAGTLAGTRDRFAISQRLSGPSFIDYRPHPYHAPIMHEASARAFRLGRNTMVNAAKVTQIIKLALDAGKANPAPPVGPALGAAGVNIMQFCKEYNAATSTKAGQVIPVEITSSQTVLSRLSSKLHPHQSSYLRLLDLKKVRAHLIRKLLQLSLAIKSRKLLRLRCRI